jgi:hypothetical protein
MGDRGQVHIEDTGVYLYTHWGATSLPSVVSDALARDARWNDPEYLTRIIFDEMTGLEGETTGYGIGQEQHGDVYRVVHIDCSEREGRVETGSASWHDDDSSSTDTYTFEEFANTPDTESGWPSR